MSDSEAVVVASERGSRALLRRSEPAIPQMPQWFDRVGAFRREPRLQPQPPVGLPLVVLEQRPLAARVASVDSGRNVSRLSLSCPYGRVLLNTSAGRATGSCSAAALCPFPVPRAGQVESSRDSDGDAPRQPPTACRSPRSANPRSRSSEMSTRRSPAQAAGNSWATDVNRTPQP